MPALIAYLMALAVFLGASYGGLQYVSGHQSYELMQSQAAKLVSRKKFERQNANRLSAAGAETEAVTTTASSAEGEPPNVAAAGLDTPGKSKAVADTDLISSQPAAKPLSAEAVKTPMVAKQATTSPAAKVALAEPNDVRTDASESAPFKPTVANVRTSRAPADGSERPSTADKRARKANRAPHRSRLVMMTLQTIQYEDGSISQRLVPFRQRD